MSVVDETERAVEAARADGIITESADGVVAVLLHIAGEIDSLVDGVNGAGKLDNVSVPTYLKYAEALGLTPVSRKRLIEVAKGGGGDSKEEKSSLAKIRAIGTGKAG